MRTHCFKLAMLAVAVLAAGCASVPQSQQSQAQQQQQEEAPPPKNPEFVGEMAKFNAQFPNDKATQYEDVSIAFNNKNKLDEKGGCHDKSKHPVTIILVLDASGKVASSLTDVENAKAACFRNSYASVQFPRPPVAPYRKAILLR